MSGFHCSRVDGADMVFREDFYSPQTVASNGGVVTGPLRIDNGAIPTTNNSCKIVYPGTRGLICGAKECTIIVDLVTPADVASVTDLFTSFETGTTACRFSKSISAGFIQTLFFRAATGTNAYVKVPVVASTRYHCVTVFDGDIAGNGVVVMYLNGVPVAGTYAGTFITTLFQGNSQFAILTQEVSGLRSIAGTRMLGVRLYNRAFTAADVREDYLEART